MLMPGDARPKSSPNTCAKAVRLLVEGRLKQDTWEDKNTHQKQSKLKVVLESFSFIDSKGTGRRAAPSEAPRRPAPAPARRARPPDHPKAKDRARKTTTFHFNRTRNFMAKTEVILIQNIVGLGGESDLVKVAAGYARNYLFPQGLAVPVTAANKRRIDALKKRRGEREAHEFNTMTELSKSISKLIAVLQVKTGDDGKMFGSVTAGMIADQLKTQFDIVLDKRKIHLEHPIKVLGEHDIELRLHAGGRGDVEGARGKHDARYATS